MGFSKNQLLINSVIFISLFVLQQIIAFVWASFNLVSIYWNVIIVFTFFVFNKLNVDRSNYYCPILFFVVSVFGALLSHFIGNSLGQCIIKVFYAFLGFVGFLYLDNNKVNTRYFSYLLILLYVFFYFAFYRYDISFRADMNQNLFGHSSSNTIAISLNIVLFVYYIIEKSYSGRTNILLIIHSLINLFLIGIQDSRMGIAVAALLLVLIISDYLGNSAIWRSMSMILVFSVSYFLFDYYYSFLVEHTDIVNIHGYSSYVEDVRSFALTSFFSNMSWAHFFLGYPNNHEFVYGISRTFNAFIDFWSRYGFFPFLLFIYFFIRRVLGYSKNRLQLYVFLPLLLYSSCETLWGGTLWDILMYLFLFYNPKKNNYEY